MNSLRILVADDHDLVRRGIRTLIEAHRGWEICAEANTGSDAVAKAEQLKPDVAILDISMPELNGVDAARRIRKTSPRTEILILSMHHSDQLIRDILAAGVRGFVVKSDSDRDLIAAIEAISRHTPFLTSCATEVILSNIHDSTGAIPENMEELKSRLTTREREVVQLISEAKSTKEVAQALGISVKTAETHRANIMRKLEVHSVTELVRYAIRNQIVEA